MKTLRTAIKMKLALMLAILDGFVQYMDVAVCTDYIQASIFGTIAKTIACFYELLKGVLHL